VAGKFTRIPKTQELIAQGVPTEVIPTYAALADYANNRTGECWPAMETLAKTLGRSVRTIQRHIHLLAGLGLIKLLKRRRHKGRFSSYLYRVLHIASTTGHGRRVGRRSPKDKRTKRLVTPPNSPPKDPVLSPPKDAFNWFFGKERNLEAEAEYRQQKQQEREEAARRRREGYEWLFE
jgi:hypothetical protein